MSIRIRTIERADHDAWRGLWTDYLGYYRTTLPDAVKDTAFNKLLDAASACHGLLAVEADRPVGLVHYIFHDHMWRPQGVCYLQDLYCAPDMRGKGVGRALIEAVYAAADAQGVPQVYWLTQDFNVNARRLYDRVGKLSPFIKYDRP